MNAPHKRVLGTRVVLDVAIVVGIFLVSASFLPIADAPPLVDEPIFASSAFEWVQTGTVNISGLSAPNAVFDTVWGGLFVRLFGQTYAALRWSTIALTALSAPFFYWLLRQVSARHSAALLGTAAYLFSPLVFALSTTFMTDMHASALGIIATAFFVRAFRQPQPQSKWLILGSAVASVGFLNRQQVLVVPIAALLTSCVRPTSFRPLLRHAIAIAGPPTVTYIFYDFWSRSVEVPFIRTLSMDALAARFIPEIGPFLAKAAIMAVVYTGIIALPLASLLVSRSHLKRQHPVSFAFAGGAGLLGLLAVFLDLDPTSRQTWVSRTGLAAVDRSHLGERPELWPWAVQALIVVLALFLTVLTIRAVVLNWPRNLGRIRILLMLEMAGFIAAAVLSSMTFHRAVLDRYWLPLIPLTITLIVAVARISRFRIWLAAAGVALVGAFGVIGMYDGLVAQREVVRFANDAIASGIDPLRFDGGAPWSAITFGVADKDGPLYLLNRVGPYWLKFYAVESDPVYGVALEPLEGYEILERREFPSILHLHPTFVYLVRRDSSNGYFVRAEDF